MLRTLCASTFLLLGVAAAPATAHATEAPSPGAGVSIETALGHVAPKPLFRDPVYDGAADPVVIWNPRKGGGCSTPTAAPTP